VFQLVSWHSHKSVYFIFKDITNGQANSHTNKTEFLQKKMLYKKITINTEYGINFSHGLHLRHQVF